MTANVKVSTEWIIGWYDSEQDPDHDYEMQWYIEGYPSEESAIEQAAKHIGDSRSIVITVLPVRVVIHKHYCMDDEDAAEYDAEHPD